MRRMYEFLCPEHGLQEALRPSETTTIICPRDGCTREAQRAISKPRIRLEGISGSFPTAADRWARVHEEAARVANKRNEGKYDQPEIVHV